MSRASPRRFQGDRTFKLRSQLKEDTVGQVGEESVPRGEGTASTKALSRSICSLQHCKSQRHQPPRAKLLGLAGTVVSHSWDSGVTSPGFESRFALTSYGDDV